MYFKDQFYFLSNFYTCDVEVEINGVKYNFRNAEAAFHACSCPEKADYFRLLTGFQAKQAEKTLTITDPDWRINQLYAMAKVLHAKFQNTFLLVALKCVKDEIINENYWDDTLWGVCINKKYKGEGKNILGKMLMNIRDSGNDYGSLLAYINRELIKYV